MDLINNINKKDYGKYFWIVGFFLLEIDGVFVFKD